MATNATTSEKSKLYSVRLNIKGRVQGVFFRATATTEAQRLGLVGYVRNMLDNSVELMAQGTQQNVDAIINWAHVGPPMAVVSAVDQVEPMKEIITLEYSDFQLRKGLS